MSGGCVPCKASRYAQPRPASVKPRSTVEYVVIAGDGSEEKFDSLDDAWQWQGQNGGKVRSRAVTRAPGE